MPDNKARKAGSSDRQFWKKEPNIEAHSPDSRFLAHKASKAGAAYAGHYHGYDPYLASLGAQQYKRVCKQQASPPRRCGVGMAHRSVFGLPMMRRRSRTATWWRRFMLLVDLTYTSFFLPFSLATITLSDGRHVWVNQAMGTLFVIDLIVNFHVERVARCGVRVQLIDNGPGVAYLYWAKARRGSMLADTVAALPWFVTWVAIATPPQSVGWIATVALLVLRLSRVSRVFRLVGALANGDAVAASRHKVLSTTTLYLGSLAYCTAVCIHLLACLWYFTGLMGDEDSSWLTSVSGENLVGAPLSRQYLAAVYFTFTTVTTVGYGDVTAKTSGEEVVACVVMLCGATFLSFIIGTVSSMINSASPESQSAERFRNKAWFLDLWFVLNPLRDTSLDRDVYDYYYSGWTACMDQATMWAEVVEALPHSIRAQLVADSLQEDMGPLAAHLWSSVHPSAMLDLCAILDRTILTPDMPIFWKGEEAGAVYVLQQGEVLQMRPMPVAKADGADAAPQQEAAGAERPAAAVVGGGGCGAVHLRRVLAAPAVIGGGGVLTLASAADGDGGDLRDCSARTATYCLLWRVDRTRLRAVLELWPELHLALCQWYRQQETKTRWAPYEAPAREGVAPETQALALSAQAALEVAPPEVVVAA